MPLINETADLIAQYDPALASIWKSQPFNRITIALAFARGFAANPVDDVNPIAALVIRAAYLDRDRRATA